MTCNWSLFYFCLFNQLQFIIYILFYYSNNKLNTPSRACPLFASSLSFRYSIVFPFPFKYHLPFLPFLVMTWHPFSCANTMISSSVMFLLNPYHSTSFLWNKMSQFKYRVILVYSILYFVKLVVVIVILVCRFFYFKKAFQFFLLFAKNKFTKKVFNKKTI